MGVELEAAKKQLAEFKEKNTALEEEVEKLKVYGEQMKKVEGELAEAQKESKMLRGDLGALKKNNEKLAGQLANQGKEFEEEKKRHEQESQLLLEQLKESQLSKAAPQSQGAERASIALSAAPMMTDSVPKDIKDKSQ